MKKMLTIAAVALVAVGCSESNVKEIPTPEDGGRVPVSFGATAGAEVQSAGSRQTKATVNVQDLTQEISIFAFSGTTIPASSSVADAALVTGASPNTKFIWMTAPSNYFKEEGEPTIYWPSGTGTYMSFVSYFPYRTNTQWVGTDKYLIDLDLTDQLGVGRSAGVSTGTPPNYGFARAEAKAVERQIDAATQKSKSVALSYKYQIAKISLFVKGDGDIFGGTAGLNVHSAAGGEVGKVGIKSVKLYTDGATGSFGLKRDYKLDLLAGTNGVATGSVLANSSDDAIQLQPQDVAQEGAELAYVLATGYLVPVTRANMGNGVTVELVYNDGTGGDQTYKGVIGPSDNSFMPSGIVAGNHYMYVVRMTASGITFTGTLADWTEVDVPDIPLESE